MTDRVVGNTISEGINKAELQVSALRNGLDSYFDLIC